MTDPVDDYYEEKRKQAAARHAEDHQLWQTWRQGGKQEEHLEPLLNRFEDVFSYKARQWRAPNVDESAFRGELKQQAINAFHAYNPDRGASLRTFLNNRLKKAQRFNQKYQNMAYMSEDKTGLMGPIQRATDSLHTELGRPPTPLEIADHLRGLPDMPKFVQRVTPNKIKQVLESNRRDVPGGRFESDLLGQLSPRHEEVLSLMTAGPSPVLTQDEQKVFRLMEQRKMTPGQVAAELGLSSSAVSRLRTSINDKFKRYT
jgi:DNA-directed RNA polymerase specialized sigma subunit